MRYLSYLLLLSFFIQFSCSNKDQSKQKYLATSNGNINNLQVIMPNEMWNTSVGETVRKYFAAPTDGLPQDEPIFSMRQIPPHAFEGFVRNSRIFLHVDKADKDTLIIKEDVHAKPQLAVSLTSTSVNGLIDLLDEHHEEIINAFKETELKERQRRTKISRLDAPKIKENFGVEIEMPSAYRLALVEDDFIWIRKDLESGYTTNIMIYEVPMEFIDETNPIASIIEMRDTVGSSFLPVEDDSPFITEAAYAPYLFEIELDGKPTYESKGTWEVKDSFMGGPFVNYAIKDIENNRYLILEGFTHAPSIVKRDLQFELESILKTVKFIEQ